MKTYIHMNHRIREKRPSGPVIAVQRGKRRRLTDTAVLMVGGKVIGRVKFRRSGLKAVTTHEVRAWVELYNGVTVR